MGRIGKYSHKQTLVNKLKFRIKKRIKYGPSNLNFDEAIKKFLP